MTEIAMLQMGGVKAAVNVSEKAEKPQFHATMPQVNVLADHLFALYKQGAHWPKSVFSEHSSSVILQAVRLFCQQVNYERSQHDMPQLDPLQLEVLVAAQTVALVPPLQALCAWTVLARIGARAMRAKLAGHVAILPMPPRSGVKLSRPADNVGKTHYVVTHVYGDHFMCRGYVLRCKDNGEWELGAAGGNRWLKDLWLTPGLQTINALLEAKKQKLQRGHHGSRRLQRSCNSYRRRIEHAREAAGLSTKNFGAAGGTRLDLENRAIMDASLACIRAMLAQVIVYREDGVLDGIVSRCKSTKAALLADATAAGPDAQAFRYHLQRWQTAHNHFKPVRGPLVFPRGYMVFPAASVPAGIPPDAHTADIMGVAGVAVSAEYLATRDDAAQLRRHPAALPEVEDLTPLIAACGAATINGGAPIDQLDVICKDAEGEETADEGTLYMRYTVRGCEPVDMLLDEFQRRAMVQFVPMVKNFQRRRLVAEDLQGTRHGVRFALSHLDISPRFACRLRRGSKRSNTTATKTSPSG